MSLCFSAQTVLPIGDLTYIMECAGSTLEYLRCSSEVDVSGHEEKLMELIGVKCPELVRLDLQVPEMKSYHVTLVLSYGTQLNALHSMILMQRSRKCCILFKLLR